MVSSNFVEVLQKTFLERILKPFSANAALYKLFIIDSNSRVLYIPQPTWIPFNPIQSHLSTYSLRCYILKAKNGGASFFWLEA